IIGIGSRKSILFILLAFYLPKGVTIIITPLILLQVDLYIRYTKARISLIV
ncbi:hypothetical protein LX36DRAFT_588186, partial [Colletotrichum falcatum]